MEGYTVDANGTVHQNTWFNAPVVYDVNYVRQRYDTYGDKNEKMSQIRFNNIVKNIGRVPYTILDVGYGNGSFLKHCKQYCVAYGNDISGYPIPEGCTFEANIFEKEWDVVCMFDVIEHMEDPFIIKNLKTTYLTITIPLCHYNKFGENWFMNWKHRRPDEHLWHYDESSLVKFAQTCGYNLVNLSHVEDEIRKPEFTLPNTLTGIFKKGLQY